MAFCSYNPDFEIGLVEEEAHTPVFDIWTRRILTTVRNDFQSVSK